MKKTLLMGALSWALAAAGLTVAPQDPAAPAAARAQGAKVTYERLGPADSKKQLHSQRARLLSLAVPPVTVHVDCQKVVDGWRKGKSVVLLVRPAGRGPVASGLGGRRRHRSGGHRRREVQGARDRG